MKAKAKAKAGKDEDEDDDDDYEDAYTALVKDSYKSTRPPVGSFENCARCKQQFTVVRYLQQYPSGLTVMLLPDQIYDGCYTSPRIPVPQVREILWSRSL